jgi:flagellar motor switch protein FliN
MMAQLEAPPAIQAAPQSKAEPDTPAVEPVAEYAHLADVPLRMEAVLDRLTMDMRAVANLQEGSVVTLRRSAGDNVDLYVAGVKLASGEIVVIENTLGVRITDLLTGD